MSFAAAERHRTEHSTIAAIDGIHLLRRDISSSSYEKSPLLCQQLGLSVLPLSGMSPLAIATVTMYHSPAMPAAGARTAYQKRRQRCKEQRCAAAEELFGRHGVSPSRRTLSRNASKWSASPCATDRSRTRWHAARPAGPRRRDVAPVAPAIPAWAPVPASALVWAGVSIRPVWPAPL